jgi:hypothetical protein
MILKHVVISMHMKLIHVMVDDHLFQPKNKSSTLGTVAQSEVLPKQLTIQGY